MGSIPRYQREKLASSVVGTPGVDASGQQVGQSVADSFENVTNTLFKIASERQAIVNEAEATKKFIDYRNDLNTTIEQTQIDMSETPDKVWDSVKEQNTPLMADYENSMGNAGSKGIFQRLANSNLVSTSKSLSSWSLGQQTANAQFNVKASYDTIIQSGKTRPSIAQVEQGYAEVDKITETTGKAVYGAKAIDMGEEAKLKMAEDYFLNLAYTNPDEAQKQLNEKNNVTKYLADKKLSLQASIRKARAAIEYNTAVGKLVDQAEYTDAMILDINSNINNGANLIKLRTDAAAGFITRETETACVALAESVLKYGNTIVNKSVGDLADQLIKLTIGSYDPKGSHVDQKNYLLNVQRVVDDTITDYAHGKIDKTIFDNIMKGVRSDSSMKKISAATVGMAKGVDVWRNEFLHDIKTVKEKMVSAYGAGNLAKINLGMRLWVFETNGDNVDNKFLKTKTEDIIRRINTNSFQDLLTNQLPSNKAVLSDTITEEEKEQISDSLKNAFTEFGVKI